MELKNKLAEKTDAEYAMEKIQKGLKYVLKYGPNMKTSVIINFQDAIDLLQKEIIRLEKELDELVVDL